MIDATPRQDLPPASLALALAQIPGLRGQLGVKGITPIDANHSFLFPAHRCHAFQGIPKTSNMCMHVLRTAGATLHGSSPLGLVRPINAPSADTGLF